jgi:hypothetical protein
MTIIMIWLINFIMCGITIRTLKKKKEINMVKTVLKFLKLQQSQYQHAEQITERLR